MVAAESPYRGTVTFTIRDYANEEYYKTYSPDWSVPPSEDVEVLLHDCRDDLNAEGQWDSPGERLDEQGFAPYKHRSALEDSEFDKENGLAAYMIECGEVAKEVFSASLVVPWNAVLRDTGDKLPTLEKPVLQTERQTKKQNLTRSAAGFVHLDQVEEHSRELCRKGAGADVFEKYGRVQIINLWRPLRGPVQSHPLCLLDYRTSHQSRNMKTHASAFAPLHNFHHDPESKWSFIPQMTTDEIFWIRCYDSKGGDENGCHEPQPYAPHAAAQRVRSVIDGSVGNGDPRLSCEVGHEKTPVSVANVAEKEVSLEEVPREAGVPQWEGGWNDMETRLKTYPGWGYHKPHSSLTKMVNTLSPEDLETREWLRTTRPITGAGTRIGLHGTTPPEPIRPGPALVRNGTGPGKLRGSPQKYGDLVTEWETGRQSTACDAQDWGAEYTQLHAGMRNGSIPPMLLEYRCSLDVECGGLTDRLFGTVTSFVYAFLTGRAFSMNWDYPTPLDLVFDSPHIDWSTPWDFEDSEHVPPFYEATGTEAKRAGRKDMEPWELDKYLPQWVEDNWENHPWIRLLCNRGRLLYSFLYGNVAPKLFDSGLRPLNSYRCVTDYLLRPKLDVLNYLAEYTSVFSLPSVYVIGIQIRTGDGSIFSTQADSANTVERYSHYFRCAEQVAFTRARKDQKVAWLLMTDSLHLKAAAMKKYSDKLVITGIHPTHRADSDVPIFDAADDFQDAIAEGWLLAEADFHIISDESGYGKFQAFRHGKPGNTFSLARGYDKKVDCRLDAHIATYWELSTTWSLG